MQVRSRDSNHPVFVGNRLSSRVAWARKAMSTQLLDKIKSHEFDCFECIYELSKHRDNVGIQFLLVEKLATFQYVDLEFFIPQLIQILVSYESECMALHDLILDFCRKQPHFCLLVFWNLQAYVFELKNQPDSYSFHIVRSFINSLQGIMFNLGHDESANNVLRENLHPALMICATIGASFGMPSVHRYSKPIIVSQGKQQKSFLFKLANFHSSLTKNLTLKNSGKDISSELPYVADENMQQDQVLSGQQRYSESAVSENGKHYPESLGGLDSDLDDTCYNSDYSQDHRKHQSIILHPKKPAYQRRNTAREFSGEEGAMVRKNNLASHSMPNLPTDDHLEESGLYRLKSEASYDILGLQPPSSELHTRRADLSIEDKTWALKANYYRKETELMMVLQNISSRLSQVPKEARLTSLRAELSIINSGLLPSQIDIPQLFPPSNSSKRKFHRILKINVTEACVLNSAERVPYLLLIEYLSEEMDFDPSTEYNKNVLSQAINKADAEAPNTVPKPVGNEPFSTEGVHEEEADLGEFSVVTLSNQKSHFLDYLRANMIGPSDQNSPPSGVIKEISSTRSRIRSPQELFPTLPSVKTRDISTQIRIAAVMLKQLEKSGQANSEHSSSIRARIISSMESLQDQFESFDYHLIREISGIDDGQFDQDAGERKLENDFKIGEDWATKRARIRKRSAFGHLPNWELCSVIVKNGDDLQQEAFACQLISVISHAWNLDNISAWTKNMKIVITSSNSGLVETINNALSIHSIKKTMTEMSIKSGDNPKGVVASIKDYFLRIYGDELCSRYKKAQKCFAQSLAAYSIICYVLQIKDRHNGNIMLDNDGHIIHIDFGFILSNSPGSVGFEAAPFKLTFEYIEVLGGLDSQFYKLFVNLCQECFLSLRRHYSHLINLVDLMQKDSALPCFKNGPQTTVLLRQRLQLDLADEECKTFVEATLIAKSAGSVYTRLYDQFQLLTQGIYN